MNIMLYFGSFNPIHNGHLAIAEWVVQEELCDEIWLVVSPQNPFKINDELMPEADRLQMAERAVSKSACCDRIRVSDFEFRLPKPSYTIDTLAEMEQAYPGHQFSVLIGSDNVDRMELWKNYRELLVRYRIFVYPRTGSEHPLLYAGMTLLEGAPLLHFSSTDVREAMKTGRDISKMIPAAAYHYIVAHYKLPVTE